MNSSKEGLQVLRGRLREIDATRRFVNDRVGFLTEAGSQLHRRKIIPDEWQRDVLRSDARYKIINTSRQVGKSTVIAGLALHKARFTQDSLVLIFAPTQKQAKEVFAKVIRFYLAHMGGLNKKALLRRVGIDSEAIRQMGIQMENASRIEALSATENTSRGFSADLIIIDEAAFATNAFYESILPSIAVSGGELVLASTPFGKRGFFYEEWKDGTHFQQFEVPATDCPRMSDEFLAAEKRRRGERYYNQEYLCSFEDQEDQVFREDVIQGAFSDDFAPLFADFDLAGHGGGGEEDELVAGMWDDFGS